MEISDRGLSWILDFGLFSNELLSTACHFGHPCTDVALFISLDDNLSVLQVLIDLKPSACLNTNMSNASEKSNLDQNIDSHLNAQANWRLNRGDVHFLMKRLKKNKQRKDKEKLIFTATVIGVLVISGIIISF